MIDAEKLTKWSKEIYETSVAHGWHEEEHSPEHYLGLIMTEVAEAVEADRKGNRCRIKEKLPYMTFDNFYRDFVKGTVEEEFSDIVIRLLDMAYSLYGEEIMEFYDVTENIALNQGGFCEQAWWFLRYVLGSSDPDINFSINYIYLWAEHLGIDLDQHIDWKMKYNSLREYKHGGKKY